MLPLELDEDDELELLLELDEDDELELLLELDEDDELALELLLELDDVENELELVELAMPVDAAAELDAIEVTVVADTLEAEVDTPLLPAEIVEAPVELECEELPDDAPEVEPTPLLAPEVDVTVELVPEVDIAFDEADDAWLAPPELRPVLIEAPPEELLCPELAPTEAPVVKTPVEEDTVPTVDEGVGIWHSPAVQT